MKILFVSIVPFENNTSATIQNKGIVKGLYELGHSVDILTLKPNQNTISFDESMNDIQSLINKYYYIELDSKYEALMAKKVNKNIYIKQKEKNNFLKAMLRIIVKKTYDSVAIFDAQKSNVKQVSKVKLDYNQYDIIISASDPKSSHLIVETIYKDNLNCKAQWIQYWGDPMFNDISRKRDWRDRIVKYQEKRLISKADKIIYASPLTLKVQKETFPDQDFKMEYANQVTLNNPDENSFINRHSKLDITVGYFGAYHSAIRNIIPLYETFLSSNYKLNICGSSNLNLKNTKNIKVHGVVQYREAVNMENTSDILITICNSSGTQIPGKIYYCAAYIKPIIIILDGEYQKELREYFQNFDRYILCENNKKSITEAINLAVKQINNKEYSIDEQLTPAYMARKILAGCTK